MARKVVSRERQERPPRMMGFILCILYVRSLPP